MSKRDEMLREILSDPDILKKYDLRENYVKALTTSPKSPFNSKLIEVLSTIINENDNGRTTRQIYPIIKNIHKI